MVRRALWSAFRRLSNALCSHFRRLSEGKISCDPPLFSKTRGQKSTIASSLAKSRVVSGYLEYFIREIPMLSLSFLWPSEGSALFVNHDQNLTFISETSKTLIVSSTRLTFFLHNTN